MKKKDINLLIIIILFSAILFLANYLPAKEWIDQLLLWSNNNSKFAWVTFSLIYIVSSLLLLPGSIITLAGGFIFGLKQGIILSSIASTIGATASFILGRYLIKKSIQNKLDQKFKPINRLIYKQGFLIILLLRLTPIIPYNILNYVLSISNVSINKFILASWLGMLPMTILYTYLGTLAVNLKTVNNVLLDHHHSLSSIFLIGLITTVLLAIYAKNIAKKIIKKRLIKYSEID